VPSELAKIMPVSTATIQGNDASNGELIMNLVHLDSIVVTDVDLLGDPDRPDLPIGPAIHLQITGPLAGGGQGSQQSYMTHEGAEALALQLALAVDEARRRTGAP
jgi:hypothetical protein